MRILITGSSGFIGKALKASLEASGHEIIELVRNAEKASPAKNLFFWNPEKEEIDCTVFKNLGAIINLAGENIFDGRWSKEKKKKILNSRVQAARIFSKNLSRLPPIWIQTSAIGFYGDRKETALDESSSKGTDFLADVCEKWEEACLAAASENLRSVVLRFGIVLGPGGGILGQLGPLFRLGLGGKLGSGKQWMSWIALDDLISMIEFCLEKSSVRGILNAVSPSPATNAFFTKVLSQTVCRPAYFSIPAWLLRLVFGREKADCLLLSSAKVMPRAFEELGFSFRYPTLEKALAFLKTSAHHKSH